MLIKKIIETSIDIGDPNDMFSKDRNDMILNKLSKKFVGICYHSCFIIKINRIIRRSYIYMKDNLDGGSQCNILFEVDAIIYISDEIINGCQIIKKEQNGITHAKCQYAGIQLSIPANMAIFKENDIVPMIVKKVRYNINQKSISVLASPFIPIKIDHCLFKLNGVLTKQESDNLNALLKNIDDDLEIVNSLNQNDKKIYNFFVDLLSNSININVTSKSTKIPLKNILQIKAGIVYRDNSKYNDPFIYNDNNTESTLIDKLDIENVKQNTKKTEEDAYTIIDENIYIVLYKILLEYLSNIQTLLSFINHYPSFASVQTDKHIWKMYSMLKK